MEDPEFVPGGRGGVPDLPSRHMCAQGIRNIDKYIR